MEHWQSNTNPDQSGHGSNDNELVLYTSQISRTETSSSDAISILPSTPFSGRESYSSLGVAVGAF